MNPDVIVVGGGPAGMMTALLLARAGVRTTVLEKHADFLRDFRGDTVHPSTMQILDDLALLRSFLQRPHNRIDHAEICYNGRDMTIGDLTHLRMPAPFIAMMPQWEFLDFVRESAIRFPSFSLRMESDVVEYVHEHGRCVGVRLAGGEIVRAGALVIACDGRGSRVRKELPLQTLGAPIDVFWFALPKATVGTALRGVVAGNRLFVLIDRGDYWQCAAVIAKGGAAQIIARGIEQFRADVSQALPDIADVETALPDWDAVRLLSVSLDRLTKWSKPGLLAIGDAAHAMSPVGGIGINLAIQDAVATANLLVRPLARKSNVDHLLPKVQRRRMLPTRAIQMAQGIVHERVLSPLIDNRGGADLDPPLPLRMLDRYPLLRRLPGYVIGHGFRQERVRASAGTTSIISEQ